MKQSKLSLLTLTKGMKKFDIININDTKHIVLSVNDEKCLTSVTLRRLSKYKFIRCFQITAIKIKNLFYGI